MSSPDPVGSKTQSALRTVLEYLQSFLPGTATPEMAEQGASANAEHASHGLILADLASAQETLNGIDTTLVANEHRELNDLRAVLRQQLAVAAAEHGRAATPKDLEVVNNVYTRLAEQAARLKSDAQALVLETNRRGLEAAARQRAVDDYGLLGERLRTALAGTTVGTAVVAARNAVRQADGDYRATLANGSASDVQRCVDAFGERLNDLDGAERDEAEARQKVATQYEGRKAEIAAAQEKMEGGDANPTLLEAQVKLTKAESAFTGREAELSAEDSAKLFAELEAALREAQTARKQHATDLQAKAWTARAGELAEIRRLNDELKSFGATEEGGFTTDLVAITKAADDKDYKTAGDGLNTLAPKVRAVHGEFPARKQWTDLDGVLQDVKLKLGQLKTWADPDEPGFDAALKAIEVDAGAKRYGPAVTALNELNTKVLARHGQHPDRGTWLGLKGTVDATDNKIGALETEGATEVPRLRYELKFVRERGARDEYAKAIADFAGVRGEVDTLHTAYTTNPARKLWAACESDYLSVKAKVEELEKAVSQFGIPNTGVAPHVNALAAVLQAEASSDFAGARQKLLALKPKVDAMHGKIGALVRHSVEMDKRGSRKVEAAEAVPPGPAVDTALSELASAKLATDDAVNLSKAQLLDGLRQTLLAKADAVLNAYASSNPDKTTEDWAKVEYPRFWGSEVARVLKKARAVEPVTKAIATLQQQLELLVSQAETSTGADQWQTALGEARTVATRAAEILTAEKSAGRAAKALHARYGKLKGQILGMKAKVELLPQPRTVDQDGFLTAYGEFDGEHSGATPDYPKCMTLLVTKLEPALKKVLATHVETLKQGVTGANTGALANAFIDQHADWELRALPSSEQVKLLSKGRETWATPALNEAEEKKRRELQRKIYQNMQMDDSFLEHEAERRQELVDSVKNDADFRRGRQEWNDTGTTWEARKKVLQKLADAQCKAFGFGPPPVIKLVDLGGNEYGVTNGYFDPGTKAIVLNTNRYSSANDFRKALDLIVHENSHYYQDQLCTGLVDPKTTDPRVKAQVEMFKVNDGPGGYVPSGEDHPVYQIQPLEAHAHFAGPETASGIVAYLDSDDTEIDLSGIGLLA